MKGKTIVGKIKPRPDGTGIMQIIELRDFECDCGSKKGSIRSIELNTYKGKIECDTCGKIHTLNIEKEDDGNDDKA
jgi:transcription elongation factor Elf1